MNLLMLGETMINTNLLYKDNTPDLRFELYRGRLVHQSIPSNIKNKICQFLLFKLQQYFSLQEDFDLITLFNVGVRTGVDTSRVPDLLVCPQELWQTVGDRPGAAVLDFKEIPALVIEVQESRADYLLKKAEYAIAEIPEVWMVDPTQRRIRVWTEPTREDGYERADYFGEDKVISAQFPGLDLTVDEILNPVSYTHLMQEEVNASFALQDEYSTEWQQQVLAWSEYEELQKKYNDLEELVHNELQEKAILLELIEDKGIDLRKELTASEFSRLASDIAVIQVEKNDDNSDDDDELAIETEAVEVSQNGDTSPDMGLAIAEAP
ncbi:MAG: Uma2 family endonuclease [Limnothrix sp.]